jgi:hypothetical protein
MNGDQDGDVNAVSDSIEPTPANEITGTAGDEKQASPVGQEDEAAYQPSDMELLSCVIEELEERFPGDEGQERIQEIVQTIREEYERAQSIHASTNGDAGGTEDVMDST